MTDCPLLGHTTREADIRVRAAKLWNWPKADYFQFYMVKAECRIAQAPEVIHTPINVTASPANIATVRGSENSIHAQSIVTGGLR